MRQQNLGTLLTKMIYRSHILGEIMIQRRFFVFLIHIMTAMLKDLQFSWTLCKICPTAVKKTVNQELTDQIEF